MAKRDAIQPVAPALPAVPTTQVVKIRNLITSPMAMRRVALGEVAGLPGDLPVFYGRMRTTQKER